MRLVTPRVRVTTEGVAATGETSPKGTVTVREAWDGRVAAAARPAGVHYGYNDAGEIRKLTMDEMIERGYFIIGKGPA